MLPRYSSERLVGRGEELALLEADLASVVESGPRAVVIGGEAGVGKTRLVEEFGDRAAEAGALVVVGSAIECADVPLPYAAVSEALRSLVRSLGDDGRRFVERVRPELARLVPELADDDLSARPSHAADETARGRLFEAVLWLLDQVARTRPMVLVIEDLHWADRSSRDLVSFLVRNLSTGVLLVVTYRRDEQPRGHPLRQFTAELSRSRRVRTLELAPLTRAEVVDQLTAIGGRRPPAEVLDTVWARSEGNPFFAEELFAAALRGDGRNLPPTLHDLLLGALHALLPDAQHVVRVAAAGGPRVGHRLLAEIVDMPEAELLAALREAVTQQVLVSLPDEGAYAFRHALLHEVAYGELLPGERTRVHAGYARTLEGRPELLGSADAVPAELARHWSAAQKRPAALVASIEAAAAAEVACGFAEAHRHLERAIELWSHVADTERPDDTDWSTLVERAAENAHLAGDHRRAAALVRLAVEGAASVTDEGALGLLHERLGCYLAAAGQSEDALSAYAEAVRLVPARTSAERARVLTAEARALLLAARYRESQARAEEAVAIGRQAGARLEEGQALCALGFDVAMLGEPDVGVGHLRQALAIADEVRDLQGLASAYRHLAVVLSGPLSRLDEAFAVAQEGLGRLQQVRLDRTYGVSLQALAADTLFRRGRWDEAEEILATALHHDPTGGAAIDLHLSRAKLSIGRGRFEAAAEDLRTAGELSARAVDAQFNVPRSTLEAGWALWEGRLDDARAAVTQALADLADTDDLWLLGPVLWHGLRVEAERAAQARATRRQADLEDARGAGRALLERASRADAATASAGGPLGVLLAAYTTMCEGEASRIEGAEDPAPWAAASEAWDRLGQPYPAAYCRWREAEARLARGDRSASVGDLVRQAHGTAADLGAAPLREAIAGLAGRGRVELGTDGEAVLASAASAADDGPPDLGLTRRERQVLALVSTGRTNREIAEVLFISEKTASVHVSNILTKLGVRSRVEAAGMAQRLGVTELSGER